MNFLDLNAVTGKVSDADAARLELLRTELRDTVKGIQELATKASPSGFTDAERKAVTDGIAHADRLRTRLAEASSDAQLKGQMAALGSLLGGDASDTDPRNGQQRARTPGVDPSTGELIVPPGRVRLAGFGAAMLEAKTAQVGAPNVELGAKAALQAGTTYVPVGVTTGMERDPERPRSILELIPAGTFDGSDLFSFWQQTVRTNNAAPVAKGALKPTSVYTIKRAEERARTIAHLSEAVPKQDLDDAAGLAAFLDAELRYGLEEELEDQILTGSGTGENFRGLLATSGLNVVPYATSAFTTTRKAVTALQLRHVTPTAWAVSPSDWETLELAVTSGGDYVLGENTPVDGARRLLWGFPVVPTVGLPAGVALLGDWRSLVLMMRQQATVEAYTSHVEGGTVDFEKNLVRFRAELRVSLGLLRPFAFARVGLVSGAS